MSMGLLVPRDCGFARRGWFRDGHDGLLAPPSPISGSRGAPYVPGIGARCLGLVFGDAGTEACAPSSSRARRSRSCCRCAGLASLRTGRSCEPACDLPRARVTRAIAAARSLGYWLRVRSQGRCLCDAAAAMKFAPSLPSLAGGRQFARHQPARPGTVIIGLPESSVHMGKRRPGDTALSPRRPPEPGSTASHWCFRCGQSYSSSIRCLRVMCMHCKTEGGVTCCSCLSCAGARRRARCRVEWGRGGAYIGLFRSCCHWSSGPRGQPPRRDIASSRCGASSFALPLAQQCSGIQPTLLHRARSAQVEARLGCAAPMLDGPFRDRGT